MASLKENIARAIADFDGIKTAIEEKGVTVGNIPTSQYADKIGQISSGGETSGGGGEANRHYFMQNCMVENASESGGYGVWGIEGYRSSKNGFLTLPYKSNNDYYFQIGHLSNMVSVNGYHRVHIILQAFLQTTVTTNPAKVYLTLYDADTISSEIINSDYSIRDTHAKARSQLEFVKVDKLGFVGGGELIVDIPDGMEQANIGVETYQCYCCVSDIWLE